MHKIFATLGALALLCAPATAGAPLPTLTGSVTLGGAGGWDYVAVDPAAGMAVAEIAGLAGVHGIATVTELNRGFITCGKDDTLAVIDLTTSALLARLKMTGHKPDAVVYDPASKRIFVMNNGGGNLTVVDPATQAVLGTVTLGGAPEFAQPDGQGRLFVNNEELHSVAVVDTRTLKVVATWPLKPHGTPTGMAIDPAHGRLFVGCRSKSLVVLDLATGAIVAALPIGAGVDACAFDPGLGRVYASCKDGTVAVIQADAAGGYALAGTLKTEPGSKTMALDAASHTLYVPAAGGKGTPGDAKGGFQVLAYR